MKTILIVDGSTTKFGGVQRHILDLVEYLEHEKFIVVRKKLDLCTTKYKSAGAEIEIIDFNRLSAFKKIYKLILKKNVKVIHTHGPGVAKYGLLCNLMSNLSHIHTMHGNAYFDKLKKAKLSKIGKIKLSLKYAQYLFSLFRAKVISVSNNDLDTFNRLSFGFLFDTGYIPNGTRKSEKVIFSKKKPDLSFKVNLLSIINHTEQKNIPELIRAVHIIMNEGINVRLKILGGGPLLETHEKLSKSLGLTKNIDFLGFVDNKKKYYDWCDFIVMPSLWEGLPYSILEAMQNNQIVITTPCNGMTELILDQITGFVTEDSSADSIAKKVLEIVSSSKLDYAKLSSNAYEHHRSNYCVEKMCKLYGEIYGNC